MANDMQFIDKHAEGEPKVLDLQLVAETVGEPKGLAPFVQQNFGVELDKGQQRSDWLRRPLTEAQVKYSMADAEWLPHIYDLLKDRVTEEHWMRSRAMYLENKVRVHTYKPKEYGVGDKPEEWQAIQKWLWERREEEARKYRRAEECPCPWIGTNPGLITSRERLKGLAGEVYQRWVVKGEVEYRIRVRGYEYGGYEDFQRWGKKGV